MPQIFVHQWNVQSSSVHIPCSCGTFRQLASTCVNFLCISGIQSTFCSSVVPSVNFCEYFVSVGPPKTFRSAAGPSVNFSQLFVQPRDLTSTFRASTRPSINFLCIRGIFHQLSVRPRDLPSTFCVARDLLSTSVNFPCLHGAFAQLSLWLRHFPSTFTVAG